jgi:hypothetical protein
MRSYFFLSIGSAALHVQLNTRLHEQTTTTTRCAVVQKPLTEKDVMHTQLMPDLGRPTTSTLQLLIMKFNSHRLSTSRCFANYNSTRQLLQ